MKKFVSIVLSLVFAFGLCACMPTTKTDNGEQTLEVYLWDAGYGTDWLVELLKAFGQEDWVKEKYPDYKYGTVFNDQQTYTESRLNSPSTNTIDLFMGENVQSFFGTDILVDLTECVYNSTVPGEETLFKDRMNQSVLGSLEWREAGHDEDAARFYSVPWMGGMGGLVYNATLFDKLGLTVPNTTDELVALCQKVKEMGGKNPEYTKTHTIVSSKVSYMGYMYPTWWAQYETAEQYENYYKGIAADGTRNSVKVISQQGRLEAYKVMEALHKDTNGYFDESSLTFDFVAGQTRMFTREGLIMANGDWFASEMRILAADYAKRGLNDTMRMMHSPVVSAIVNKTPSLKTVASAQSKTPDEVLSAVITEVDAGKASSEISGITQADFDVIKKARGVIYSIGANSLSVIPTVATAKDVAIDFLRFLSTPKANEIYARYTYGAQLSFDYKMNEIAPDMIEELKRDYGTTYAIHEERMKIMDADNAYVLKFYGNFPLARYGGLIACSEGTGGFETMFSAPRNRTAEWAFEENVRYWTDENNKEWKRAIQNAQL